MWRGGRAWAEGRARVLAVHLPLLLDVDEWAAPRLNGYEPLQIPEPAQAKVMRVPFTALLGGEDVYALTPDLLATSPFLRLEKLITYKPVAYMFCGGDLDCLQPGGLSVSVENTFGTTNSAERTLKVGLSVSHTVGVEAKVPGFGGASASTTITASFDASFMRGWSRQQLETTGVSANMPCPSNHACAAWTGRTFLRLYRRMPDGSLARFSDSELAFDLGAPIYFDDYP